jgi:hypothetical protein
MIRIEDAELEKRFGDATALIAVPCPRFCREYGSAPAIIRSN